MGVKVTGQSRGVPAIKPGDVQPTEPHAPGKPDAPGAAPRPATDGVAPAVTTPNAAAVAAAQAQTTAAAQAAAAAQTRGDPFTGSSTRTDGGVTGSTSVTGNADFANRQIFAATATAALKALVGSTTLSDTGTLVVTNNQLSKAQFLSALQTIFGPHTKLQAGGTFTLDDKSGASAQLQADFKTVFGALALDSNGTLTVTNGKLSGALEDSLTRVLGDNTLIADGKVLFGDTGFQSASLEGELIRKLGPNASLTSTLTASVDHAGVVSATATAAFKALVGGTTVDTSGTQVTLKNNTLTDAQLKAAVTTVFGKDATLSSTGVVTWNKDTGATAALTAAFKETVKNLTLDAQGNLTVKAGGKVDATLQANVQAVLGSSTVIANNQVVFKDSRFFSATLNDELKTKFSDQASLDATLKATVKQNGLVDGTISLSAFKRLKELGNSGAVDLQADGTVIIKDDHVDRAEVSALLTLMAGKDVNVSGTGKLIYADGKVDPQFSANLKAAWDNTTLSANGTLTLVDGKPQVTGQVGALFGTGNLKGGATVAITGADSGQLDLKLQSLGAKTNISQTGSLVIDHGKVSGIGLTTNLVTQGKTPADVSLSGLISLSDSEAAAHFNGEVSAGPFAGGLGVGTTSSVEVYTATAKDPDRLAIQQQGGVWAQRSATFDLNANASVGATVLVGAVPITLGFKADADVKREVHTLTIHPSKDDALAQSPITVIHPPSTLDQVLAMRPFEQFSDSGTQAIGMGGNAAIGIGEGPASIKAGGSVYFQITGNLSRDFERLEGDKVRVRFTRGTGTSSVKAITANVGLDGGKLAPDSALAQKAAPLVNQLAQAGVSAKWDQVKQDEPVFDVTVDLSTPWGRSAMQHLLSGELTEAQYWADYKDSGVQLNSQIDTDVTATTRTADLNVGLLNKESLSRWLDDKQTTVRPGDFTFTEAVDAIHQKQALLPWHANSRADVRFVHETRVANTRKLPDVGELTTTTTMHVHVPDADEKTRPATLADSAALFGLRFRLDVKKTSQSTLTRNVDTALAMMKAIGFNSTDVGQLDDSGAAAASGLAPKKQPLVPLFGLGDERFGQTAVDVEGFLGPKGFAEVFGDRSKLDYRDAYLEAAAIDGSVVSTAGTRAAIERTLGAQLTATKDGAFDVIQNGARIGTLTAADIVKVRASLVDAAARFEGFEVPPDVRAGTWVGKAPHPLVEIDESTWVDASQVVARAEAFSGTMLKAAKLWSANQAPVKLPNEEPAAYDARLAAWQDSSLFKKPDVFYAQMDEQFRAAIQSDSTPTTALAVMGLAGPSHIYGKAQVELPPDKLKAMIDKGRGDVQTFGAAFVLAGLGAHLDAGGTLKLDAAPNLAAATAAAKQLFGPNVKVAQSGGAVTVSNLTFGSDALRDGLTRFFGAAKAAGGSLRLQGLDAAAHQALLTQVFAGTATLEGGHVVFDNRAYGIINFTDALSPFKGALGVAQFPSLQPIADEGVVQAYDLDGLIARHDGADSHWGETFSHLEYLSGANEDLGAVKDAANGWILTGSGR